MFRLYASFIIPFTVWPLVVNLLSLKPIPPPGLLDRSALSLLPQMMVGSRPARKDSSGGAQQNA